MHLVAGIGTGFLAAVLWFDLMFDTQARNHSVGPLAPEVIESIAGYYRRVTTTAHPMARLVAAVMITTMTALVFEASANEGHRRVALLASLTLTTVAVGIAGARTVRNAKRLGTLADDASRQADLARSILRDHISCFVLITTSAALQFVGS